MKRWVLVEWLNDSAEYETILEVSSRSEALAIARVIWKKLSAFDQRRRSDFYLVFTGVDEDGLIVLDSACKYIPFAEIAR